MQTVEGFLEMCARLDTQGIEYRVVESPQSDLLQIYAFDPNQVQVEINIRGETAAVNAARAAN